MLPPLARPNFLSRRRPSLQRRGLSELYSSAAAGSLLEMKEERRRRSDKSATLVSIWFFKDILETE